MPQITRIKRYTQCTQRCYWIQQYSALLLDTAIPSVAIGYSNTQCCYWIQQYAVFPLDTTILTIAIEHNNTHHCYWTQQYSALLLDTRIFLDTTISTKHSLWNFILAFINNQNKLIYIRWGRSNLKRFQ